MVTSLDHVQLAMPAGRESEAHAFYEGVLGIPEIPKPSSLNERGGCWFVQGDLKLHLGIDPDFRPARKAHPAFIVDDLEALKVVLTEAGHPFRVDDELADYHRIYVDDPFGNRIELMEPRG